MGKCLEICTMAVNDFPSNQQSDRPSVGREEYGFDSTALAPLSQAVHGRKWHEPKTGFSKHDTESANKQLNVTRQRCCSPHLALIKHSQQPYLYCTSFEGYCPSRNLRPKPLPQLILSPVFHLFYFGVWIFPYLPVQAFGSSNHQNNSKLRVYSL